MLIFDFYGRGLIKKKTGQAFAIKKIQKGLQEEEKARTRPAEAKKGKDRKIERARGIENKKKTIT